MEEFSVTVLPAAAGTCSVMLLAGEADLTTTALRDALAAEIVGKPRLLLLDMTELTFIDSGAAQMITGAHQVLSQDGGTLALVHPGRTVGRVLELTGISQVIHVYDSVSEAITAERTGAAPSRRSAKPSPGHPVPASADRARPGSEKPKTASRSRHQAGGNPGMRGRCRTGGS